MTDRPDLASWLLNIADVVAQRATCDRLQVGAVLARQGRILSTGYNGAPAGMVHCTHEPGTPCTAAVHAETNAIAFAARHGVSVADAQLYLTHSPCLACSGLIINSGIAHVFYRRPYRDTSGVLRLRDAGIFVEQIQPAAVAGLPL